MRDSTRFSISDQSTILHAGSADVDLLLQAIRDAKTIFAGAELAIRSDDPQRLIVQTAGSTGTPKKIRRTPSSWRASFETNRSLFEITDRDTYAVFGRLSHSLALYGVMEALHLGCDIAILDDMSPTRQAKAFADFGVSVLYGTPTQLRLLLRTKPSKLSDIRLVICGGGKMDASLHKELGDVMPKAQIIEFFGASETSFITLADQSAPAGSVGRPYPDVSVRIGDDLPAGQVGEIWVKSPYLFEDYESGESAVWDEDHLSIGEMGLLDESGHLFLKGRKKRMVTIADQNVFPEAIEARMLDHPAVSEAAVITPEDALRGHSLVAFVASSLSEGDIRKLCRETLGPAAVPRDIMFLETLPKLAAGKPDLQTLMKLWQEHRS
ncbi:MAG: AMP-binding protein [Pseudomonadota bacterium]|nr:AMP-binding protein [Pseudomonadota bacterium]